MGNAIGRPCRGWDPRIIPRSPRILVGNDERAPAKDVKYSDIPTQLLDSTRGGGNKDALGSGKGKRKQAPVQEAKDSGDPRVLG